VNCLRSLGPDPTQWALHVPLGKLRTERLVPVDEDVRQMVHRILTLRAQAPASQLTPSAHFLLPRSRPYSLYENLRVALNQAAQRSGCSDRVTPHRLRHTYASEMIRLGVSLPAVMKLLGHKTIRMTLRYVQVTQRDLQREFHLARQNAVQVHHVPNSPSPLFYRPPPICQASCTRSLPLAICWKCIVASLRTTPQVARYDAWTSAFTLLPWNSVASPQPQNEERLAGQWLPSIQSNFG